MDQFLKMLGGDGGHGLVGSDLCLDMANTVGSRENGGYGDEKLNGYPDLIAWAVSEGALEEAVGRRMLEEAVRRPAEAAAVLEQARELREAIYRIFSAVAAEEEPKGADLSALNRFLATAAARIRIVEERGRFSWVWAAEGAELDAMLWPAAVSAAELLVSDRLERVRECAGETCGWLFIDMSRNRSRRWCDMSDCGNRAKARRHYHRTREKSLAAR